MMEEKFRRLRVSVGLSGSADVVLAHTKQLVEVIFSGNIPLRSDRIVTVYASFTDA